MSMPLSHFVPASPSPSPCPQVHSLRLSLYSSPAPGNSLNLVLGFQDIYDPRLSYSVGGGAGFMGMGPGFHKAYLLSARILRLQDRREN